ncbi:hypothetical protein Q3G72_012435 [Acer saccharum]|nr:hypothetical protein Q3G72_012435 [Acer saccharum]
MLSRNPSLLTRSLQNSLIPCYDFLKSLVLVDADENIPKIFKRLSWDFPHHVQKNVVDNVSILRGHGVPPSVISVLISYYPNVISCEVNIFSEHVKEIIKIG